MAYPISGNTFPLKYVNPAGTNIDNSHTTNMYSSQQIPNGPHAMAPPGNKVESAAGIYPCAQKGGSKKNKISRKYKMKSKSKSRRSARRRISRMRSKHARRHTRRIRRQRGGAAMAPNYPLGHLQYQNNQVLSSGYSAGANLPPSLSALAMPVPIKPLAPLVDNLNHAAPNAYGNYGAGSGFPSRGWF
jgi:hypothetical protein